MRITADFHIHSGYSRATSKDLTFSNIYKWANFKGLNLVGTGDFTHPSRFSEIESELEETGQGLFKLKDDLEKKESSYISTNLKKDIRFILTGEISTIYKKNNKVRKVHHLVIAPDILTVKKINSHLNKIGNIKSDGRPILGLDSKELLKIILDASSDAMLIPAHAWTPHFSIFGSVSGFDSIPECFEELSNNIYAIETGLSSDPKMNWMLSKLDNITLISNSDAHSLAKLGREANIFDCDFEYLEILSILKNKDTKKFLRTIEFFPEEGKYHLDGHRACEICFSPEESKKNSNICPKCHKKLTIGVMNRVFALSDRKFGEKPEKPIPYYNLVGLLEIIAEVLNCGVNTKRVMDEYFRLLHKLGSELDILMNRSSEDIQKYSTNSLIARAILKMRTKDISIKPGYDGEYGKVKIFDQK
jgi:uncharacterized protein (TIGR00375 family)